MKRFYKFSLGTIHFFWIILFGLTVVFAFLSPNLILGDNDVFGTSTTLVTTDLLIFLVGLLLSLATFSGFRQKLSWLFVTNKYRSASVLLVLVLVLQVLLLVFVHPVAGFDAGMLHYAAVSKDRVLEAEVQGYFSLNQNNLPIMLVMRKMVEITGQTSWQFFDYVTLFFVDLSVLLNILTVRVIAPKAQAFSMYLQGAWLLVFPSILMPYTDTWVLPLVSGYFLCYFVLCSKRFPAVWRFVAAGLCGSLVVLTYFIKPSAIIPVMAIFLLTFLRVLAKKIAWEKSGLAVGLLTLVVLAGFGTYQVVNHAIDQQDYIQIDASRNIPIIHFASMGITGTGGYDEKQALDMASLATKADKSEYSKEIIVKRLKELKVRGYLAFLVTKHNANTADGTFGWLKEGNFFRENQNPSQEGIANKLKNFLFLYGAHIADFRFAAQLVWLFCLLVILFGWGKVTTEIWIMRLSLVGAFLFLLLFEGGRSRYLIQFLPCFIFLASLSWSNTKSNLQKIMTWWQADGVDV